MQSDSRFGDRGGDDGMFLIIILGATDGRAPAGIVYRWL
jgi:hypothetical protein